MVILIDLVWCYEKIFINENIYMVDKNFMKHHYKQEMNFKVTWAWMRIINIQNEFDNLFETKNANQTRFTRKLSKLMYRVKWIWSTSFSFSTGISMTSSAKNVRSKIRTIDRCWFMTNGWERYQRRNESVWKIQ